MLQENVDSATGAESPVQPPVEKTPISHLQELCTKRGVTPHYDLVANEGAVHEPLFVFKVTAGDVISTGKGPSKKKAKHSAAVAALQQMLGVSTAAAAAAASACSGAVPATNKSIAGASGCGVVGAASDDGQGGNPVGELQETTQKRMWPPPVYDFASEQGPPHAREFVCIVRLFNVAEQAVGKSKKLAKRNAAVAMLQLIRQGLVSPKLGPDQLEDCDDDNLPLPHHDSSRGGHPDDRGGSEGPPGGPGVGVERRRVSAMFQGGTGGGKGAPARGKLLEALQGLALDENSPPPGDCCQRLQALGREQKFETNYIDIDAAPTADGSPSPCLCMLQLTTVPVTMCHGSGADLSHAHAVAARNALNYLKIMTKKC